MNTQTTLTMQAEQTQSMFSNADVPKIHGFFFFLFKITRTELN